MESSQLLHTGTLGWIMKTGYPTGNIGVQQFPVANSGTAAKNPKESQKTFETEINEIKQTISKDTGNISI